MVQFLQTLVPFTHKLLPPTSESNHKYRAVWSNQDVGPLNFEDAARKALTLFQRQNLTQSRMGDGDTQLFPMIQAGAFGIREEEEVIDRLIDCVESSASSLPSTSPPVTVDLTSGYFGLYAPYKSRVLASPQSIRWRIVAASPEVYL